MNRQATPIGDYGMIGDTRTAALIAPDGSVDWMCLPRFDSPPVFGRLVGGDEAGWFRITPSDPTGPPRRRYRGDTATLETTWPASGGELTLADSMIAEVADRMLPDNLVIRHLVARGGPVRVRVEMSPRFGYERKAAQRVRRHPGGFVASRADMAVAVTTDAEPEMRPDQPVEIDVSPERPVTIVLSASHRGPAFLVSPDRALEECTRDETDWQRWSDSLSVGAFRRREIVRSFITLRLLTYSPSGAPVAAPTTSLPEVIGGSRNWDYRYAWPRDASIGIAALLAAGKPDEAKEFLAWLLHASRLARPRLPALFTVHGRPAPEEQELTGWPGYRDSPPVRTGNGAGGQHQLDGYGWVLDAAWRLEREGHRLNGETWRTMRAFADRVAETWMLPDAGIWERRGSPRHHVHSKLMGWLALDRAIRLASRRRRSDRYAGTWRAAAGLLAEDIRRHGWDDAIRSYTAAYDSTDLDASLLLLTTVGFEPEGSPRVTATVDAVRRELGAGGPLLYRYRDTDNLPGEEGAFLPCSFWLVQALSRIGRRAEAEAMFADLLDRGGELGLFAEEMSPATGEHLGNFPQALTHATLLEAGLELAGRPISDADA